MKSSKSLETKIDSPRTTSSDSSNTVNNCSNQSDELIIEQLEEDIFFANCDLFPSLQKLYNIIQSVISEVKDEKNTISTALKTLLDSMFLQVEKCLDLNRIQNEKQRKDFQKLIKLYKKKVNKTKEQLNRRLSALEEVKVIKDDLIVTNLQFKKKISVLKKSLSQQKIQSGLTLLKVQKESLEIKKKHNWINHCNMRQLNISLENSTFTKPLNFLQQKEYNFNWNFNEKTPFIHNFENDSLKKHSIKAGFSLEYGGLGLAPSPLQYLMLSILAEFVKSFVTLCSINCLKLKEVFAELILQKNYKKYLGFNVNDILIPLINTKIYVQSSEHPEEIQRCFEKAKSQCCVMDYLISSSKFELDYDLITTEKNMVRKENAKSTLNGLKIKKVKKLSKKYQKKKTEDIEPFTVQGFWNVKNNNEHCQFKGYLSCEKKGEVLYEIDWPIEIGGTNKIPDWHEVMAASISSMSLSTFVLYCTIYNIKIDDLGITYLGKWDQRKLYNLVAQENDKTITDNNINIKYHIKTNELDDTIKKIVDLVKQACVGYNLANGNTQIAMNLQINEDIPQSVLLKLRKLSLLDHK
ncbi:hydroperoxide reductase [Anaeramoeba flamelloides]|uniref:Hydroperoxide reductase n=1 Tax=Anaeramoeba flamelloides TaxID=1746091 RepID=A0AAV7Y3U0_9EUKA|nr:hydroperoxide reductase [Anaeramoeba flamelloides]